MTVLILLSPLLGLQDDTFTSRDANFEVRLPKGNRLLACGGSRAHIDGSREQCMG
ncbi:MAG: hypothetical protein HYY17_00785 [Planctomycetes bacterium]|nr:hypothetical protein [Planctomycetota bacterium]